MLLLLPLLNSEKLEIHYWFKDNSHNIDAVTLNKSQHEIIALLQEIAKEFDEEILIEIEPYAEGGFKQIFKVLSKQEKKGATIIGAVVLSTITAILITPLTKIAEKTTEHIIDKVFEDKSQVILNNKKDSLELRNLELKNENLELQNKKLNEQLNQNQLEEVSAQIINVSKKLENNIIIKKRRSNFYEQLANYEKIDKVSFRIEDRNNNFLSENFIKKQNFNRFILHSDIIEPQSINDAKIEIISPVLKKGYYKWTGIYKNEPIPFLMKSAEFKELVQKGQVEFKNGFTINCELQINKKVDNEGITRITGYEVVRVDSYFINDKPVETNEGKKHRKLKEAETQMLKLFRYEDDEILPFE
ncbi:hypothetical protein [Chryseobacterium taeanense]|uniref:hypothetical protein n=1 Tax=Chryseobacterium taeanense TaxID=311334 RepID=UPI0035AFEA1A